MKYLTIAKHSSLAAVIRTWPVWVQFKSFFFLQTVPFLLKDFARVFGGIESRNLIMTLVDLMLLWTKPQKIDHPLTLLRTPLVGTHALTKCPIYTKILFHFCNLANLSIGLEGGLSLWSEHWCISVKNSGQTQKKVPGDTDAAPVSQDIFFLSAPSRLWELSLSS